jgi:multidrug efflux pump subunit AcrB
MRFLPLTLIITLSSSLFVALVIVPTACALWLNTESAPATGLTPAAKWALIGGGALAFVAFLSIHWLSAVLLVLTAVGLYTFHHYVGRPLGHWVMTRGLPAVLGPYERLLRWALGHRGRVLAGAAGTFVAAVVVFGFLNAGIEFFPEDIPPKTVYVQIEAPLGTRVEETDRIARQIEAELDGLPGREDIQSVVTTVGSMLTTDFGQNTGTHLGTVAINFVDYQERQTDAFETLELIRRTVGQNIAGADISVEVPNEGPPTGRPVTIEITGADPDVLRVLGDSVVRRLENAAVFAKLDGLESDMAAGRSELVVDVDREKAALYGLNTQEIGSTIRSAFNGTEASKYRDGKDEYDITVRLAKSYREDLTSLADLTVMDEGTQVPLSSVARWYMGRGFGDLKRKDLDRVVTVSSDVRTGHNANAVLAEVQQEVAGLALPPGYRLRYAGQQQEQDASQAFLMSAFLLAIMLIGFILVAQFDSVTTPLIILTSVVMSTVGVLVGLMIFRMPFGIIMTGVGVISLAGVVVNNAIVLLDYTKVLRTRDGLSRLDAMVRAGRTRFRPVWLTAITTVLGLVPLAVGLNFDFIGLYARLAPDFYWGGEQAAWWGPMAITVITGLLFATVLTLVLVPVLYSLLEDMAEALRRWFAPARDVAAGPEEVPAD